MWDDDGSHSICICWEIFVYIYYKYCPRYTITISWINIKCIIKRYLRSLLCPKALQRLLLYILYIITGNAKSGFVRYEHWTVNLSAGNNSLKLPRFQIIYALLIASSAMHIHKEKCSLSWKLIKLIEYFLFDSHFIWTWYSWRLTTSFICLYHEESIFDMNLQINEQNSWVRG